MYQNIYIEDKYTPNAKVHIWDDKLGYKVEEFNNYGYVIDDDGQYESIFGDRLKKKRYVRKSEKKRLRNELNREIVTFETDVRPETRYLVDNYLEGDEVSDGHCVLFFDIEVSMKPEVPDIQKAQNTITSIAYYDDVTEQQVVLILDEDGKIDDDQDIGDNIQIEAFNNEKNLLERFVNAWRETNPTIVTGYNCLDKDTGVWLKDKIVSIKDVETGDPLSSGYGDVQIHAHTGDKKAYEISLVDGSSIVSSQDHIFYACQKPKKSYTSPRSLLSTGKDMTTKEIMDTSRDIYVKKQLGGNQRTNATTYKQYLTKNLSTILEYDNIDIVISSTKIRDRLKQEHPDLVSDKHIPRQYWWGKNFHKTSTHHWSYSNLSEYVDLSEIAEMIESSDETTFLMCNHSKTLDLNTEINEETLHLLGLLYTDGTYDECQPCIYNTSVDLFESILDEINNHRVNSYSSVQSLYKNKHNVIRGRFNRNGYIGLLLPMVYDVEYDKTLNINLLSQITSKQFFSFLGGCIDGDGHITENSWNLATFNGDHDKIQTLLAWNGVFSTVHCGGNNVRIPCDRRNVDAFGQHLNTKIGYKKKPTKIINRKNAPSKNLKAFHFDGFVLLKVNNVSEIGCREMYDITTQSSYFLAGPGIKTHNCDYFDIPYLYRRLRRVFSEDYANRLSPIGKVDYNERKDRFYIAGVSSLDYYQLYKNFTFSQLDSYTLDNVSNEELDEGKITYKGREYQVDGETRVVKDLDDLLELDIERFVKYNMEDVMLLVKMDAKLDFIELTRKICHLGHVPYEDIYNSSRYIDGAILTYLKRKGLVAPDKKRFRLELNEMAPQGSNRLYMTSEIPKYVPKRGTIGIWKSSSTKKKYEYVDRTGNELHLKNWLEFDATESMDISLEFPGAYVKSPDPGLYEWVYDLDLTSMYPCIIMTLNISPETKVGKIYGWDAEKAISDVEPDHVYEVYLFDRHEIVKIKKEKLIPLLRKRNLSVASNGVFYRNDIRGTIPSILEKWFTLRQNYKGTRNEWREKATEISDEHGNVLENENQEDLGEYNAKAEYYDKLQHVHKILINSVYGVLGLSSFRFYDVDNAQAVTDTGRNLIQFTQKMGDKYYNDVLGTDQTYCIYTDTDSVNGSTEIETDRGRLSIEDLYSEVSKIGNIQKDLDGREFAFCGGLIKTLTYTRGNLTTSGIDYVERHRVPKQRYRVTMENGTSVVVTEDHSLMVEAPSGNLIKKRPANIEPDDVIVTLSRSN